MSDQLYITTSLHPILEGGLIIRKSENRVNRIDAYCNFGGNWDYWLYDKRSNKLIAVFKTKLSFYRGIKPNGLVHQTSL